MAFALLAIGILLITSAVRNTSGILVKLIGYDFSGPNNFVYWVAALLIIGSVGYIDRLKPFSDAFLVLVILVLFLSKGNPARPGGGFFKQMTDALSSTGTAASVTVGPPGTSGPVLTLQVP